MRLLTDPLSAAEQYVETARRTALAGVSGGLERRGGRLNSRLSTIRLSNRPRVFKTSLLTACGPEFCLYPKI